MSLEEKIRRYRELSSQIAELEAERKALGLTILEEMPQKTLILSGYVVRRYDRLSIKTPLEQARLLDATKMEEVLDKDKLKNLYQSGEEIPGISSSSFIQISLQKQVQNV